MAAGAESLRQPAKEEALEKARQDEVDRQKAHDDALDLPGLRAELNSLRGQVAELPILRAQLDVRDAQLEMAKIVRHLPPANAPLRPLRTSSDIPAMKLSLPSLPRFSGTSFTVNFADWVADAQALTEAAKLDQSAALKYAALHPNDHALQVWRKTFRLLVTPLLLLRTSLLNPWTLVLVSKFLNGRHVSSLIS